MVKIMRKSVSILLVAMMVIAMVVGAGTISAGAAAGDVVYFEMPSGWSTPYCHVFKGSTPAVAWPGIKMTLVADNVYSVTLPGDQDKCVFNNGSGSYQTNDLSIPGNNKIFKITSGATSTQASGTWEDYDTSAVKLSFTTDAASPQYNGTDITLNAKASGGSGTYTYKFSVGTTVLSDFSANASVVWTAGSAGTYTLKCEVKDTNGNTNEKTISYVIQDSSQAVEPVLKGITPKSGSTVQTNSAVTVDVNAAGGKVGTNLLFYKVAIKDPSGNAVNTVYYTRNKSITFTPTRAGKYTLDVSVQNSNNDTETKTYELTSGTVTGDVSVTSFNTSASSPQPVGTNVTLTASAAGGTAPYQYQFTANGSVIRSYSNSSSYVWTPTSSGTYTLGVTVKDSSGKTATSTKSFTINSTVGVSSFNTNITSPQKVNTAVKLTASATGGTAPYQYQFTVNGSVVQPYSTTNSYIWKANKSGTYTLGVTVKDSSGKTATATKSFTITEDIAHTGDINGDGETDLFDALMVQKHLAGVITLTPEQLEIGDLNNDGETDLFDVLMVQKYLAGIITL